MSGVVAVFRWEFRQQALHERVYAEGSLDALTPIGGPSAWMLKVELVKDVMRTPTANGGTMMLNPDLRDVVRIYVGSFMDRDECELIAHLGAVHAAQRAYRAIFNTLVENPDKVRRFADDWLLDTIEDAARRRAKA